MDLVLGLQRPYPVDSGPRVRGDVQPGCNDGDVDGPELQPRRHEACQRRDGVDRDEWYADGRAFAPDDRAWRTPALRGDPRPQRLVADASVSLVCSWAG